MIIIINQLLQWSKHNGKFFNKKQKHFVNITWSQILRSLSSSCFHLILILNDVVEYGIETIF